ncbi:tyrosine protein phosphatase [Bacillus shivajii]|uniref:tyrosine-protein phosphatase n=1 Tax=Bacillus shivajii TaxID=1983719 RepID=UPI001CFB0E5E|nr:CpsB/CapC family capsule biosynthesis tyrosine phosphatase [Bacillus shivajii]UCZ52958.1 tyrosine protein phosphatase [Bacillus shivajii]
MIDLHCHILPGVDDGAQTMEDVLEMAKVAEREGITRIVATPHHQNGKYINEKQGILDKVSEVNAELKKQSFALRILPGQECRLYGEILEDYDSGKVMTLANSQYLFVEFPSAQVPRYAKQMLYDIQLKGLTPVIVHPERNQVFMKKPEMLYNFVKDGSLTQVTAGSVAGKFGKKIRTFSLDMIEANLTHFLASDAHNTTNRSYHLLAAYDDIEEEFGESLVYFFRENAEIVLEHGHVMIERPEKIRQKKFLGLLLKV